MLKMTTVFSLMRRVDLRRDALPLTIAILLLAGAVRIVGLGDQPLWIDEGFSYIAVDSPDLMTALIRDVHPPLYFLMLRAWAAVAGISEFALRIPSVMLGLISVALMLPLAREVNRLRPAPYDSAVPLIAALLLAVAEFGFYIAQETRSYSLHVTLAALSMWAFLRWARTGERRIAAVWVLAGTALLYTHYLGAWVGVTQGIYALWMLRGRQRLIAVALLTMPLILFSGWLVGVVLPYQTTKADSDATIDPSTLSTLMIYARQYLTQQWALMLGLLILGVLDMRAAHPRITRGAALLVLWIIIAVALTYIGNTRFSIMTNYRLSQIIVPLALLWAFGLVTFRGWTRGFLLAVIVLYGGFTVDIGRYYYPWDTYARSISAYAQRGDVALMDFRGVDFSMEYYLERQLPPDVPVYSLRAAALWEPERLYNEIPQAIADARAVWVAQWSDAPIAPLLLTDFTLTHTHMFEFQGIVVTTLRYDRPLDSVPLARFENGMVLARASLGDSPQDMVLLWQTSGPLDVDYTVSAFLLDADGRLAAQIDSMPAENQRPTSQWQGDGLIYDPRHMVTLDGAPLTAGTYQAAVKVYRHMPDGMIQDVPLEDGQPWAIVGTVTVE